MEIYLEGDVWVSTSPAIAQKFLEGLDLPTVDLSSWPGLSVDEVRRRLTSTGNPVRAFLEAYGFEYIDSEPGDEGDEIMEFSWAGMWRHHEDLLKYLETCGSDIEGEVFDPDSDDGDEPYWSR